VETLTPCYREEKMKENSNYPFLYDLMLSWKSNWRRFANIIHKNVAPSTNQNVFTTGCGIFCIVLAGIAGSIIHNLPASGFAHWVGLLTCSPFVALGVWTALAW
jgi:hypothetical protein